jgi:hypothetical protein
MSLVFWWRGALLAMKVRPSNRFPRNMEHGPRARVLHIVLAMQLSPTILERGGRLQVRIDAACADVELRWTRDDFFAGRLVDGRHL